MKNIIKLNQKEIASVSGALFAEIGNFVGLIGGAGVGLITCFMCFGNNIGNGSRILFWGSSSELAKHLVVISTCFTCGAIVFAAIGRVIDKKIGCS